MTKTILAALVGMGLAACAGGDVDEARARLEMRLSVDDDGCPGAAGCPKAAPEQPEGKDPWPTPPGVEAQAVGGPDDAFCTNSQCFDGGDPQPGGTNWASQWTWDQCMSGCMGCSAWCKPHCTARCGP